ncbi:alpha/beta fold hydrolase [Pseudogemmobacter sp. W21_MBD1_M6]|uniref:alpha/beta fold hydrolase n=1 Tax=Pseudogemmobacter sp. W21_MBD1_M6 TaxID=3240271 RepID=UPI003F945068
MAAATFGEISGSHPVFCLATWSPAIAAFLVVFLHSGRSGIRDFLYRLFVAMLCGLRDAGFQIVAPSRFGYLRSAFPEHASPAHQADVLVELLDHLGLARIAVVGGSAGALTAAEFGLRHPDRCSHLALIVPTLILSCEDDLFGTAATARLLAGRIPGARLVVHPDGGHIWLGRDPDLTRQIADFIMRTARP